MAKCNLFKKLSESSQGTFFLFSQYAEDLTKNHADGDAYRVVPSRFAALDIDYTNMQDIADFSSDPNKAIPEIWQNEYENTCAFLRDYLSDEEDEKHWTPEYASKMLWVTLQKHFNYECDGTKVDTHKIDGINHGIIQYISDADIASSSNIDGNNYSETYIYISNSAKQISGGTLPKDAAHCWDNQKLEQYTYVNPSETQKDCINSRYTERQYSCSGPERRTKNSR